jgi:hypothetical protein
MPNPTLPNNNVTNAVTFPARAHAVLDAHNRGARTVQPKLGLPRTVWFKWNLPRNVSPGDKYEVTFSTKGSKFDTTMKVFMGGKVPAVPDPGNLQRLHTMFAGNDNAKDGPWSEVTLHGGRVGPNDKTPPGNGFPNGIKYVDAPFNLQIGQFYIVNPQDNQPVPVSSLLVGVGGVDGAQGDIRISAQRKKK